jgi:hypothetical protein
MTRQTDKYMRQGMEKQADKYQELWGALDWVSGNPIIDGMIVFEKKEDCLAYIEKQESIYTEIKKEHPVAPDVRWTIPRIKLVK